MLRQYIKTIPSHVLPLPCGEHQMFAVMLPELTPVSRFLTDSYVGAGRLALAMDGQPEGGIKLGNLYANGNMIIGIMWYPETGYPLSSAELDTLLTRCAYVIDGQMAAIDALWLQPMWRITGIESLHTSSGEPESKLIDCRSVVPLPYVFSEAKRSWPQLPPVMKI